MVDTHWAMQIILQHDSWTWQNLTCSFKLFLWPSGKDGPKMDGSKGQLDMLKRESNFSLENRASTFLLFTSLSLLVEWHGNMCWDHHVPPIRGNLQGEEAFVIGSKSRVLKNSRFTVSHWCLFTHCPGESPHPVILYSESGRFYRKTSISRLLIIATATSWAIMWIFSSTLEKNNCS